MPACYRLQLMTLHGIYRWLRILTTIAALVLTARLLKLRADRDERERERDAERARRIEAAANPPAGASQRDKIGAVVDANIEDVRFCYQRELLRVPKLQGTVTLEWLVTQEGSVSRVTVVSSTLSSPAVATCLKETISTWSFPPLNTDNEREVIVRYPFIFRPEGRP